MKSLCLGMAALALATSCVARADEAVFVQVPAVLDSAAPIGQGVKNECGVETLVGNHVFQEVSAREGSGAQVLNTEQVVPAALKLTIISALGAGGGAWSGRKSIGLRADFLRNGRVVRTAMFERSSKGGFWGGMSGTCPIMERIAVALGKDVAKWLPAALLTPADAPSPGQPSLYNIRRAPEPVPETPGDSATAPTPAGQPLREAGSTP